MRTPDLQAQFHNINWCCAPHGVQASSVFALMLCLLVCPALVNGMGGGDEEAGEAPIVQVRLDEWRSDLPPGGSVVVEGGGLINNGFPALSADRSQIAILYYAGHPMDNGYPTFEIHSTATLALEERIELWPEIDTEAHLKRNDPQVLMRIEGLLDDINHRLLWGGFRTMETLFQLESSYRLDGVEKLGKRIDYPSSEDRRALSIKSLSTGQLELDIDLPSGVQPHGPEGQCSWGGSPRQAWYEPELRLLVLRVTFMDSIDGCEQPEQWILKRL